MSTRRRYSGVIQVATNPPSEPLRYACRQGVLDGLHAVRQWRFLSVGDGLAV